MKDVVPLPCCKRVLHKAVRCAGRARLGAACLAVILCGVAFPVQAACDTLDICIEQLRHASRAAPAPEDTAASMMAFEHEAVVNGVARVAQSWDGGVHYSALLALDELPDEILFDALARVLARGSDGSLRLAGWLRLNNRATAVERLAMLPERERSVARATASRLAGTPDSANAVRLALLLEPERAEPIWAWHVEGAARPGGEEAAKLAWFYMRRAGMRDAFSQAWRRALVGAEDPARVIRLFGVENRKAGPDWNWIRRVRANPGFPEAVRTAALNLLLHPDNPAPPPWEPETEAAVWTSLRGRRLPEKLSAVAALYPEQLPRVLDAAWGQGHRRDVMGTLAALQATGTAERVDRGELTRLVRRGYEDLDTLETWEATEKARETLELYELEPLAARTAARLPLDVMRLGLDYGMLSRSQRERLEASRPLSLYCTRGRKLAGPYRAMRDEVHPLAHLARRPGLWEAVEPLAVLGPESEPVRALTAVHAMGDDLLLGVDWGEWGGGLSRLRQDGESTVLLRRNVQFIVPVDPSDPQGALWIMAGLNHMMPDGALYRYDNDRLTGVAPLTSAVLNLGRLDDGSLVLHFHNAERDAEHWQRSHPPLRLAADGTLSLACTGER